ncbi:MAG TPA: Sua5/YciO/YrdC/YwlC family protein [Tepidisphaeraceae bacterium]
MPAKIIKLLDTASDAAIVADAVERLRNGRMVIVPTETTYGVAAVLTHPGAEQLKKLRGNNEVPPALHVGSADQGKKYLGPVSEIGNRLMKKLWPGPVGMIFDVDANTRSKTADSLDLDESEIYYRGTVTLRCPDHSATTQILLQVDEPVAAISAGGALEQWADKVDLILDAGPTRYSRPSTLIKVEQGAYRIVREGVYDDRIIQKMLKTHILFVCSGNTCRSPMAEALAKLIAAKQLKTSTDNLVEKGLIIGSAGIVAAPGSRAAVPAIAALEQLGSDLSRHRSRPLTPELIHQSDAIFVMGENHRRAALAMAPSAANKIHLLDPAGDIDDPIGGDLALYLSLARRLNTLIADQFAALHLV